MTQRDKANKFIELANKRVNKAIKDLRLVSNLANRNNYEYTDAQAKKIISVLQKEIENTSMCFQKSNVSTQDEFEL